MNDEFKKIILKATNSKDLYKMEKIQDLWRGYGSIFRYGLYGSDLKSIIIKNVKLPNIKGNNDVSHQRKLKSYKIEMAFYEKWSSMCSEKCKIPKWYALEWQDDEFLMVLEDLDASGYNKKLSKLSWAEFCLCLDWLANFHAIFLFEVPKRLWPIGTYWHLDTRLSELKVLKDTKLKSSAKAIDKKLNSCKFKTFVHGDAKLENFCFSNNLNKVAAVDFQYVGGGCGMKDLVYFASSCFYESECERLESKILDYYFEKLKLALKRCSKTVNIDELEKEWRELYYFAWTDFYRFLKGWGPHYCNDNKYSEKIFKKVLSTL